MKLSKAILHYFLPYKLLCSIFVLSLLVEVAYAVAAPMSFKFLVDEAFTPKDFNAFLLILGLLLAGGLLNIGANLSGDYSLGRLSGSGIQQMRTDLFDHLQLQSLPFYQRYGVGDLVTRFSSDMASIERLIRVLSPMFLKELLSVLLGLGLLFALEWKLTLAMLAGSTLMVIGPRLLQGRSESATVRYKEAQERFSNTIHGIVAGHKTIRSYNQQGRFKEFAQQQIRELFTSGLRMHMTGALMERLPLTALLLLNGIMIGFGGYLIFHDHMTVGSFMAFFTLFLSVGQSGTNLSYLIPALIESKVSLNRIGEVLNHQPSVPEAPNPVELPPVQQTLRMDRVTFGYTASSNQLTDINLEIKPGSYTAFVGPSGSGKSTALQLLARFYDPKEGQVLIENTDLRSVSEASLRRLCTFVTQDTYLFNTTIRDNLLLDHNGVSEDEMVTAAKNARIHDVISSWPQGYDTVIHHEGGSLSGGERQRLAIARALIRKPKLLLLDEVTAALDPVTEGEINTLIESLPPRQTVVSVTHRLVSAVHADKIYVFKDGRVVESGTHHELLMQKGVYRSLWDKQHGFTLSQDGQYATIELDRLARLPFLQEVDVSLLRELAAQFTTETFQPGADVVTEGEVGHKFYIIVRGRVEVLKGIHPEQQLRVAVLENGDYFGEIALLRQVPRTATIRAMTPTVVLVISREGFVRLTTEHPQIKLSLEAALRDRL